MHGQFAWYDLVTSDVAAARKFYPAVTRWGTQQWQPDYMMWTAQGAPFADITQMSSEQMAATPPHWLGYVTVDDVDSSAARVQLLGGEVKVGPEDIPEVGRYAIIQDPQGAMIAIFKSQNAGEGWDGTPALGRFSWHELMTTDIHAAFRFYSGVFGWENMEEMDMGPGLGTYLEYGKGGKMFGGVFARRPEHGDMPPNWIFYVNVADLDGALKATTRGGGSVKMGPMEVPGGSRVATCSDPQGTLFALHQSPAKPAARPAAKKPARKATKKSVARKAAPKRVSAKKAAGSKSARKKPAKKTAKRVKPTKRATKKAGATRGARGKRPRSQRR